MNEESNIDEHLIAYYLLRSCNLSVDAAVVKGAEKEAASLVRQKNDYARDSADCILAARWQIELAAGISNDLARELLHYGYSRGD